MKKILNKKNMKKILKFHSGRGGQFFNSGYVMFVGFETIEEDYILHNMFFDEKTEKWFEPDGNELDYEFNGDGTGYINIDNEYDTTRCVFEDDLNAKQKTAIARDRDTNVKLYSEELLSILKEYYPEYIETEEV